MDLHGFRLASHVSWSVSDLTCFSLLPQKAAGKTSFLHLLLRLDLLNPFEPTNIHKNVPRDPMTILFPY